MVRISLLWVAAEERFEVMREAFEPNKGRCGFEWSYYFLVQKDFLFKLIMLGLATKVTPVISSYLYPPSYFTHLNKSENFQAIIVRILNIMIRWISKSIFCGKQLLYYSKIVSKNSVWSKKYQ